MPKYFKIQVPKVLKPTAGTGSLNLPVADKFRLFNTTPHMYLRVRGPAATKAKFDRKTQVKWDNKPDDIQVTIFVCISQ